MITNLQKKICIAIGLLFASATLYSQKDILSLADPTYFATNNDSAILYKAAVRFDIQATKSSNNSKLKISLPSAMNKIDQQINISRTSVSNDNKRNTYTWSGEIENQAGSYVLFTIVGEAVSGYIRTKNNEVYKIEYLSSGLHQISKINALFSQPDGFNSPQLNSTASETETCCDSLLIDVLVVYSATAKDSAHGTDAILSQIYGCETQTNQTFINSRVHARIKIVNALEVEYTESGSASYDLLQLQNKTDGQIDDVHTKREDNKADIVLLLVENTGNRRGWANIMANVSHDFKDYAFGVIKRSVASSHLIFAHELGHIMGARHEFLDDPALTPFPNSHGYHTINFRTVMSENAQFGYSAPYWSNPDVIYTGSGEPTGNTDPRFMANNAYTLNATRVVVSRFICNDNCSTSCKWYKCWVFWVGVLIASIIIILLFLRRRRRRPQP